MAESRLHCSTHKGPLRNEVKGKGAANQEHSLIVKTENC